MCLSALVSVGGVPDAVWAAASIPGMGGMTVKAHTHSLPQFPHSFRYPLHFTSLRSPSGEVGP